MRLIFFGSDPWMSPPVLAALLAAGFEVPVVATKGEKGIKFISSLVHKFGREGKMRIVEGKTHEDISRSKLEQMIMGSFVDGAPRDDASRQIATAATKWRSRNDRFTVNGSRFTNNNRPDAIVLASFGPPFLAVEVLNWPKYGCLNVHASLLPRWRGASPVFAALAEGDAETGVSIMRMTEEIDRGPILGQSRLSRTLLGGESLEESPWKNRETLTKRLGKLGGELILETLKKLEKGQITEMPQPQKSPTPYTRRLSKESGRIDWSQSPIRIERFIRAVTPWPGALASAKFKVQSLKFKVIEIKILKVHLEKLPQRDCHVPTGVGARNDVNLAVDLVQLPGKNPVSWKQFLAGHPNTILL